MTPKDEEVNRRNAWDERKFRNVLTKAGKSISCSWGVVSVRDRKTGEMETVLLFNDDDEGKFSHAFSFRSREEVAMLCANLMGSADRIHKGEFGK